MKNFIIIFLIYTGGGCCIDEPYNNENKGEIIKGYSFNGLDLLNCLEMNQEIIIRSKEEYDDFLSILMNCPYNKDKDSLNFNADIDFEKFSILGKLIETNDCNGYFIREVTIDKDNQLITYEITKKKCGSCKENMANINCVVIPSIPNNCKVVFKVR